jgi:hypothetical protein
MCSLIAVIGIYYGICDTGILADTQGIVADTKTIRTPIAVLVIIAFEALVKIIRGLTATVMLVRTKLVCTPQATFTASFLKSVGGFVVTSTYIILIWIIRLAHSII